jgi:hypothetical protein
MHLGRGRGKVGSVPSFNLMLVDVDGVKLKLSHLLESRNRVHGQVSRLPCVAPMKRSSQ